MWTRGSRSGHGRRSEAWRRWRFRRTGSGLRPEEMKETTRPRWRCMKWGGRRSGSAWRGTKKRGSWGASRGCCLRRGGNVFLMKDAGALVLNRAVWSVPQALEAVAGAMMPADAEPARMAVARFGPPELRSIAGASLFFLNQVRGMVLLDGGREVLTGY